MQNKLIIYSLLAFLLLSSVYLSFLGNKQADYNYQAKWWALYFSDPKNNSLNFAIENHSKSSDFHWTISQENKIISEGDEKIKLSETKNITPETKNISGKISITVSDGTSKKEIYKNF